ncbi:MAG: hypothetical protein GWN64_12880 [Candidatus Thorarchaeota archaeon]|nr:hypothetical protein [Candidatus Thorarchaeota archaeon]
MIRRLRESVISYDEKGVKEAALAAIEEGIDITEAIEKGLSEGIREVGEKFDKLEVFLTELMLAAEAMKAGMNILLPKIPKEKILKRRKVVIGTVKGDIHDIGKNIAAALLTASGFDVYDLGTDVPISKFVEEAEKNEADIIALSALMTSTISGQKDVISYLKESGKRENYIVMVGGGPTTNEWAEEIGADGYAETAKEGADTALRLLKAKRGK